jgi:predicted glycosyltransferase
MKVIVYCQHVLGIGHFFRTLEICESLRGHEVVLVTGGERPEIPVPEHVREVRLPGLMMDADFSRIFSTENDKSVDTVKNERRDRLYSLFEDISPQVFLIELYPFGRKAFRFELDPVLEGIRSRSLPACRVVCSLRDVLVEKRKADEYEARVVNTLNRFFDAVLVHSDPEVLKLDTTFSRLNDVSIPIVYTGFVTPKPTPESGKTLRRELGIDPLEKLVVASAGGGKVGVEVLRAVARAFAYLPGNSRLQIFCGPFMDDDEFVELQSYRNRFLRVNRFTSNFLGFLDAADLSVSMAGYNTSMNIMAAGTPALVWPFAQNREQRLRAERLARLGGLNVLADDDLKPKKMAGIMQGMLSEKKRPAGLIDLAGAENTAAWITGNYRVDG